jgi:GH15 family glucan-1,4-alpha-glucosidase
MRAAGDTRHAERFEDGAASFMASIDRSLAFVKKRIGTDAMPASPYRRMDSGAIGSLAGGYPLELLDPTDERLLATANFLWDNCMVDGGFFQDMIHSGINPYLTLHLAQIYLRAGDDRYVDLIETVARLASPTGQWPEAIHPATKGRLHGRWATCLGIGGVD